jgi:hypothetical protein
VDLAMKILAIINYDSGDERFFMLQKMKAGHGMVTKRALCLSLT